MEVVGGEKRRVEVLAAEDFDYSVAPEEHPCLALPGPGFIYAPAVEGADAGVVYVLIEGKAVGKVPVVYGATIEQTQPEEKSFWQETIPQGERLTCRSRTTMRGGRTVTERLQKILSARGMASRRKAEELIRAGQVTVNGVTATLGDCADPETDDIRVAGQPLAVREKNVYILLNKPRGYVTTSVRREGTAGRGRSCGGLRRAGVSRRAAGHGFRGASASDQ